ncbi:hypothetical protein BASA81_007095 [Batrachochytrium salamandrivorans]|nr:hypothetical protein BASA81_007095 [Batrachochytrium salamandrivorans]
MGGGNGTEYSFNVDVSSLNTIMASLVIVSLFSALPKRLLDSIPVVYVMLLVVMVFTILLIGMGVDLEYFFGSLYVSKANSQFLQALYLPPLIFSEVFKLNLPTFQRTFWQVIWLILPGVVFGAALTALYVMYLMPSGQPYFSLYEAMCFGGALSATDPIAVLIVLHEMGAPARLRALVGGESLLNDGSSIIVVALFLEMLEGREFGFGDILVFALEELILAPMIGLGVGLVTLGMMLLLKDKVIPLVTMSLAAPYIAFNLSANTFGLSGVMSLIAMGLVLNRFGRAILNTHMEHVEAFWLQIEFIATSLLYTQSGIYLGSNLYLGGITWMDWVSLGGLYVWITLVRAIMVAASFPLLQRVGYGIDWKEAVIMVHGGLRGSLCILLSFAIAGSSGVSPRTASLTLFFAAGLVLLMCINVVTTGPLCEYLGLKFDNKQPVYLTLKREIENSTVRTLAQARGCNAPTAEPPSPLIVSITSSLGVQRFHLALVCKQCFDSLLEHRLVSHTAWFTLLVATERLMEEHDHTALALLQWDMLDHRFQLVRLRMTVSRQEYQAIIDLLEGVEALPIATSNVVAEYLVFCAFALLVAQERVREVLRDTFASQAKSDFKLLWQESLDASQGAAKFINLAFVQCPLAVQHVKERHVRAQVHENNNRVLNHMKHRGVVNEIVCKQLEVEMDKMDQHVAGLQFDLVGCRSVGPVGELLGSNPNFGPWAITPTTRPEEEEEVYHSVRY